MRFYRLDEKTHAIAVFANHIIWDQWSWTLIARHLVENYEAFAHDKPAPHPRPSSPFGKFASNEHQKNNSPNIDQLRREAHEKMPRHCHVPSDRPFQNKPRVMKNVSLNCADLVPALMSTAKNIRVTEGTLLLAATHLLLSRLTGEKKILTTFPAVLRTTADQKRTCGPMLQVLPLFSDRSADPTFAEFAQQVGGNVFAAMRDRHLYPDQALQPGTRVNCIYGQDSAGDATATLLDIKQIMFVRGMKMAEHLKPSLFLYASGGNGDLPCWSVFDANMFDEKRVKSALEQYREIIQSACADPSARVSSLAGP
jgi:hypothetical protein